jgi:hypothetical protein
MQSTIAQTICTSGYTKTVRPSTTLTNGIKKRFMREQGMNYDVDKGNFELDHIIPLALGGQCHQPIRPNTSGCRIS